MRELAAAVVLLAAALAGVVEASRLALGMHAVQEAATALERACLEGAPDTDIDDVLNQVSVRLNLVLEELRNLEITRAS